MTMRAWAIGIALTAVALPASAQDLRPDQARFRELYKELVETNTVVDVGSCTQAAGQIAARLKAAGFGDDRLTLFSVPEHPNDGGLVAILPGSSKTAKPILLLAHIDVVAAKREDWERDPFKLVEENGTFYARGVVDDKAMASIWADSLIRFAESGYRPKRTIKLALTCGEETSYAFNGAQWLSENRPDLVAAEFALNEGGGGRTDGHGKLVAQTIQVGEKAFQNFRFETFNAGGHSSIPIPDNAIYELADALVKVRAYEFPLEMSDTTRAFFAKAGAARGGEMGAAMVALSKDPNDKAAEAIVNTDRSYHSMLRTTCVATLLSAGHANNALPQHAEANVNCRMFPGHTAEEIRDALVAAVGDARVKVTIVPPIRPTAKAPPLDPRVIGPVEELAAKYFPGVPVIPSMSTGATDGIFLEAIGIPVYGVPSVWTDPDANGIHGLNERLEARALYTARDYLYDLVRAFADKE